MNLNNKFEFWSNHFYRTSALYSAVIGIYRLSVCLSVTLCFSIISTKTDDGAVLTKRPLSALIYFLNLHCNVPLTSGPSAIARSLVIIVAIWCSLLSNFIRIRSSFAQICPRNDFRISSRPPSWICDDVMILHPVVDFYWSRNCHKLSRWLIGF